MAGHDGSRLRVLLRKKLWQILEARLCILVRSWLKNVLKGSYHAMKRDLGRLN